MTTRVRVELLDGLDHTGVLGDIGLLDLLVPGYGLNLFLVWPVHGILLLSVLMIDPTMIHSGYSLSLSLEAGKDKPLCQSQSSDFPAFCLLCHRGGALHSCHSHLQTTNTKTTLRSSEKEETELGL